MYSGGSSYETELPVALVPLPLILSAVLAFVSIAIRRAKRAALVPVPWPKVPGGIPILGNNIGAVENLTAKVEEWAATYGSGGVYEFHLVGKRYVVVCDDATASKIEGQRPYKMTRTPKLIAVMKSVGADGLFAAEGNAWKQDRRLVGASMNRKNVRDFVAAVKLVAHRMIDKLQPLCQEGCAFAINELVLAATVDIISLVAFNKDIDGVRKGHCPMGVDLKTALHATQFRLLSPFPYWRIPFIGQYLDGAGGAIKRLNTSFNGLVKENKSPSATTCEKTFLSKIIAMSTCNNANAMSEGRMIGNIMTMFAAGSETTHVTICSSLWEIANDKTRLQEELAAEALAVRDFDGAGLNELTHGLPRLRSLLYDVLRLRGPSPFMVFQNTESLELAGSTLPPKTLFLLPWRYISTLDNAEPSKLIPLGPRNTPRNKMCARRWLTNTDGHISVQTPSHKSGWKAFGTGARVCPGRDLAEVEMLIVLASILRSFVLALEPNHPPVKHVTRFTECPNIDIRIVLQPRAG